METSFRSPIASAAYVGTHIVATPPTPVTSGYKEHFAAERERD